MHPIVNSPYTRPEMFHADILTVNNKWTELSKHGKVLPLLFDVTNGAWISILKSETVGRIQRHRHAAAVTALTLDGAWGYEEHDWVARAGSFVYEPAGHVHTLYVHPEMCKMTTVFHVYGPVIHLDDKGEVSEVEDVFTRLDKYAAHCKKVGLSDEYLRSLIR